MDFALDTIMNNHDLAYVQGTLMTYDSSYELPGDCVNKSYESLRSSTGYLSEEVHL